MKYIQFNLFFNNSTQNKNEIKGSSKTGVKTKGISHETEI